MAVSKQARASALVLSPEKVRDVDAAAWRPNPCADCSGAGCDVCGHTGFGPQYEALRRKEFELFFGGQKGGGKTSCGMAYLAKGNTDEPNYCVQEQDGKRLQIPLLVNQSYLHHERYRALVLRKNQIDLMAWVAEAKPFYRRFGGEWKDRPYNQFNFPSGAIIWSGHLDTDDAYEKYQGIPELHRILIEEVTQIPSYELYLQIRSCCRSVTPGLIPQIMLNANPIGPGMGWVAERFIEVKDAQGDPIPPRQTISEMMLNPITGREISITRVFIPARLKDNPYLLQNPSYVANLMTLPDKLRRAYLDGDWTAMRGVFFDQFRLKPLVGEPGYDKPDCREKAQHVVYAGDYPKLYPWWPRAIGGDWGFTHKSAFYWGCWHPETQQLQVYRELVVEKENARNIGAILAGKCREDLEGMPDHSITLYFSRDAFYRRSDDVGIRSITEMIAEGIAFVLGPDSVWVPELPMVDDDDLLRRGPEQVYRERYREFQTQLQRRKTYGIVIRMANTNRIAGWDNIRSMLNWAPQRPYTDPDTEMAKFVSSHYSTMEYHKLVALHGKQYQGLHPRLQIWDTCPKLMRAIPRAVHAKEPNQEDIPKRFDGADELDGLRYLCSSFRFDEQDMPFQEVKRQAIDQYKETNPRWTTQDLVWVNRSLEDEERELGIGKPISIGRRALRLEIYKKQMEGLGVRM